MIYASAESLSTAMLPEEVEKNWLYPAIERIREVSVVVTRGVIRAAQKDGVDRELALRNISDEDLDTYIRDRMYDPYTENQKLTSEITQLVGAVAPQAEAGAVKDVKANPNGFTNGEFR